MRALVLPLAVLIAGAVLAAAAPARADRAQAPGASGEFPMADEVVVLKSERRLELRRDGEVMRSFPIALGGNPEGHKQQEGDQRTPEGRYFLDTRNPNSAFFLALRVSYPNGDDLRSARERGVDPGNNIMIHGLPNEPKHPSRQYLQSDWTDGCIAVSNAAMIDIWLSVRDGTPIHILP
jgi:murein L,D-transpeptidase YafK